MYVSRSRANLRIQLVDAVIEFRGASLTAVFDVVTENIMTENVVTENLKK